MIGMDTSSSGDTAVDARAWARAFNIKEIALNTYQLTLTKVHIISNANHHFVRF